MSDNDAPEASTDFHVNFNAPAVLRKWPSLDNQRRTEGTGPYLLLDGTLDECIMKFWLSLSQPGICMKFGQRRSRHWSLRPCCRARR